MLPTWGAALPPRTRAWLQYSKGTDAHTDTHTCTCIRTYAHTHAYRVVYLCAHACPLAHTYIYTNTHRHMHANQDIFKILYIFIHTYVQTHIRALTLRVCTCMCLCAHPSYRVCTRVHTCQQLSAAAWASDLALKDRTAVLFPQRPAQGLCPPCRVLLVTCGQACGLTCRSAHQQVSESAGTRASQQLQRFTANTPSATHRSYVFSNLMWDDHGSP